MMLVTAPLVLPPLHHVPADFLANLLRIVQRRARILAALILPAFHVFPDFFLRLLWLIHVWHKGCNHFRIFHKRDVAAP